VGGVLTGEHGVGIEKRDLMPEMFSEDDLATSSSG
jgi:glycolate oxidase